MDFVHFSFSRKGEEKENHPHTISSWCWLALLGKCSCLLEHGSTRRERLICCCAGCPAARRENNCLARRELGGLGVRAGAEASG